MGFFDLYRRPKPESTDDEVEEKLEPLPRISMSELWPPTPRVKILYFGIFMVVINIILIAAVVIAIVRYS